MAGVLLPLVTFAVLNWYVAVRGEPAWRLPFEAGAVALFLLILALAGTRIPWGGLPVGRPGSGAASPVPVAVPGMVVQLPPGPLGGTRAARRAGALLALATVYFGVALALRLLIFASNRQVWGKATLVVAVVLSLVFFERVAPAMAGLSVGRGWGRTLAAAAGGLALVWIALPAARYIAVVALGGTPVTSLAGSPGEAMASWTRLAYGNLSEEIFFRGYMLLGLAAVLPPWLANVAQALYFAVFHLNYGVFPLNWASVANYSTFTFAFGYALGLLALGTRSILAPALVHLGYNLLIPLGLFRLDVGSGTPTLAVGEAALSHALFATLVWGVLAVSFRPPARGAWPR
jgi:membrane protease YdiL (CAAX protease family)